MNSLPRKNTELLSFDFKFVNVVPFMLYFLFPFFTLIPVTLYPLLVTTWRQKQRIKPKEPFKDSEFNFSLCENSFFKVGCKVFPCPCWHAQLYVRTYSWSYDSNVGIVSVLEQHSYFSLLCLKKAGIPKRKWASNFQI